MLMIRILDKTLGVVGAIHGIISRLHQSIISHTNALHKSHWYAHILYFGAVSVEGHGMYALSAAILLVITVLIGMNGD